MKYLKQSSIFISIFMNQCLAVVCVSQGYSFLYLVQQWPGSYCSTKRGCCYPTTGKAVKDFAILGLWPYNIDGSFPSNCDPKSHLDLHEISDLSSTLLVSWPSLTCPSSNSSVFWSREWKKHGTCSQSELDQHAYFQAALKLKQKVNLLKILQKEGIKPNGKLYSFNSIRETIENAIGYTPGIECVVNTSGISQLYQVYVCADVSGANIIECPGIPQGKYCRSKIKFPSF